MWYGTRFAHSAEQHFNMFMGSRRGVMIKSTLPRGMGSWVDISYNDSPLPSGVYDIIMLIILSSYRLCLATNQWLSHKIFWVRRLLVHSVLPLTRKCTHCIVSKLNNWSWNFSSRIRLLTSVGDLLYVWYRKNLSCSGWFQTVSTKIRISKK